MEMTKKKIALPDGRYLIYYSFGREESQPPAEKPVCKCCEGKCGGGK